MQKPISHRRTASYALMSIFVFAVAGFFLADLVSGFFPAAPALSTMIMRRMAAAPWWMGGAVDPAAEVWSAGEVWRLIADCLIALGLAFTYFLLGRYAEKHTACLAVGLGLYAADTLLAVCAALDVLNVGAFGFNYLLYSDCWPGGSLSDSLVAVRVIVDLAIRAAILFLLVRGLLPERRKAGDALAA